MNSLEERIFSIHNSESFQATCLDVFNYQSTNNHTYREYITKINVNPKNVNSIEDIPFLPIQFFKTHKILEYSKEYETIFTSSGTTGSTTSKHYVTDLSLYKKSFLSAFEQFYGVPEQYTILALLPGYLEREGSSLIYMVNHLIEQSKDPKSGFYLHNHEQLAEQLIENEKQNKKTLLIGVSFALLDLLDQYKFSLKHTLIMETGGMKGRKKEVTRQELHTQLCSSFGTNSIHSEYGMTELLSQAYCNNGQTFSCPPWMKIQIRDIYDPFSSIGSGKTGGINIIDLANLYSCSFIETQDLGKLHENNHFEVLGRFDASDVRGCNLMVQ